MRTLSLLLLLGLFTGCVTSRPTARQGRIFAPRANSDASENASPQLYSGKLPWPVQGEVSSRFGPRGRSFHYGIDIRAPKGTPIKSTAGGRVVFAGWMSGYGQTIIVDHNHFRTLYGHCSRLIARKHAWVRAGDVIAAVGNTGNASGMHVHFEYRVARGRALDPLAFLQRGASPARLAAR